MRAAGVALLMDESNVALLPPFGNTGVEPVNVTVAWLAGTAVIWDAEDHGAAIGWDLWRKIGGSSILAGSNRHYDHGVRADDWGWQVMWAGRGGATGTVYCEIRQTRLEAADGLALARQLISAGIRASRLDLAGDDLRPDAPRPRTYFDARQTAWTRTHRDRWVFREDGTGRQTVNVGSGASERQARIYDHAPGVLRHELELRGDVARSTAAALAVAAPAALWAAEYGRLVRWVI